MPMRVLLTQQQTREDGESSAKTLAGTPQTVSEVYLCVFLYRGSIQMSMHLVYRPKSTDHVNKKLMYRSVRKASTIRDYSSICYQTQRSNQSSECLQSKTNVNLNVTILLKHQVMIAPSC
jgi:hypothetical protein